MRKDIYERMKIMKQDDIKPNYAALAKQLGCDYRTVKRYYERDLYNIVNRPSKPSILDPYKSIVEDEVKLSCSATAIYKFIQKKGYTGCYSVVKRYCNKFKVEQHQKATIRFETNPGLQAQVDWKETEILTNKNGEIFEMNIFLIILDIQDLNILSLPLIENKKQHFNVVNIF